MSCNRRQFSSDYSYYRYILLNTDRGEGFVDLVEQGYGLGSFNALMLSVNQAKHKKSTAQERSKRMKERRHK